VQFPAIRPNSRRCKTRLAQFIFRRSLLWASWRAKCFEEPFEASIVTNGLEYLPGVLNALWQVKWSRMQSRTVADIERAIEALTPQQREALHVWFDTRFSNREIQTPTAVEPNPGSVVALLRTLRARIPSDPEGWTTRDYVNYGRR